MKIFRISFLMLFVFAQCYSLKAFAKAPYSYHNNRREQAASPSDLHHMLENHELEMRTFQERLETQETILDALRSQLVEANLANKEMLKGNTISLEKKVFSFDSAISRMSDDLRVLQSHANETAKLFSQHKQKINDLEAQLSNLQGAMDSILIALQIEEPKTKNDAKIYVVKAGDSLEKIARKNKLSLKKLKEVNALENDRIYTGQKLKLP